MATLAEVQAKVTELQAAVDASQAREAAQDAFDKETITALQTEVQTLKDLIAAGSATPEELQRVVDGIQAVITDINTPFPPV